MTLEELAETVGAEANITVVHEASRNPAWRVMVLDLEPVGDETDLIVKGEGRTLTDALGAIRQKMGWLKP